MTDTAKPEQPARRTLRRDVADDLKELLTEDGRPDRTIFTYAASLGCLPGAVIGASSADTTPGLLLLAVAGLLAGAITTATIPPILMAAILTIEHARERAQRRLAPGRTRRHQLRQRARRLRTKTRTQRGSGLIELANLDEAGAELSRTVEDDYYPQAGLRERRLRRKAVQARTRAENAVRQSWNASLDEATETLTLHTRTERLPAAVTTEYAGNDQEETAWHLAGNPTSIAARRLLVEHLHHQTGTDPTRPDFKPGVVYTPRWVHRLALAGELHARNNNRWPWGEHPRTAVGEECVPTDGADHETIEKLYEPYGDGPLSSLQEAVDAAKHI